MLIAFTAQTFDKAMVMMDFYANRSELAEKYCVNKSRPMLHCNGHCFLMKMMKKEDQKQKDLADKFQNNTIVFWNAEQPSLPKQVHLFNSKAQFYTLRNIHFTYSEFVYTLLKPPIVDVTIA